MHSDIVVSQFSGQPMYLQIMDQVKQKIAVGEWAAGEEIPSIRQLAVALRVSVITVKRAYLELEREGVVHKRHGSGTYISDAGSPLARKERLKILSERVDALLAEARHLEREGVIVTHHGKGSFVAPDPALSPRLYEEQFAEHLERAAQLGASLGLSEREIVSRLRKALDQVEDGKGTDTKLAKEPL